MIKIIDKQKEPKAALLDCKLEERQAFKKSFDIQMRKAKERGKISIYYFDRDNMLWSQFSKEKTEDSTTRYMKL